MNEPNASHPRATPDGAPVAWLRGEPTVPADPALGKVETQSTEGQRLRAAVELVLASPAAVADVIGRAPPDAFPLPAGATRHDGWTGERMARFLEVLADTGIVSEACRVVGMSREAARQLRNRNPVFAAAHEAALSRARAAVADGLLERSITGTVEHYYRDGMLVGERRHYESWLGLAVLKRLDRQAEMDRADGTLAARIAGCWHEALDALRGGGSAAVPAALEPEVAEVDIPPPPGLDPSENCWKTGDGAWMTVFPPPSGFAGHESGSWDGLAYYERACTAEEAALLEAHEAALRAEEQAELTAFAEAERDAFFARLRRELGASENAERPQDQQQDDETAETDIHGVPPLMPEQQTALPASSVSAPE